MKIAVVGAGVSGLVTAHLLGDEHDVTVFEANAYPGGHTNTITVDTPRGPLAVDTGFIVFNPLNYPNFCRLLDSLGVASQPSDMSFAVSCDRTGLEYNGTSVGTLFARRRNALNPRFYRMLRDILRFNRDARALIETPGEEMTLDAFLTRGRYGSMMIDKYLVPMGAAIWSTDPATFRSFPARFMAEFMNNHMMLHLGGRPQWRTVVGGSKRYVEALLDRSRFDLRLSTPVRRVARHEVGVTISTDHGDEPFDHVVMACHSDQSLRLLVDATEAERAALEAIPYQVNEAVLHTDASMLPKRRRAWAAWNYHIPRDESGSVTVTYNMNILQSLDADETYCVTLNEADRVDPAKVIRRVRYEHPVYTERRREAHDRFEQINHTSRTSFCGAYWGHGFHEDGVKSALAVCARFGKKLGAVA